MIGALFTEPPGIREDVSSSSPVYAAHSAWNGWPPRWWASMSNPVEEGGPTHSL